MQGVTMELENIILIVAALIFIYLFIKILSTPIRWAFKLLLNALLGFVILFVVNFFGGFVGITVSVGWVSALVAGILGIPGVILLVLIETFLI